MHTFTWTDPATGAEVYVQHNQDMSGNALVTLPVNLVEVTAHFGTGRVTFGLPAKVLADFSRAATLSDAIAALKQLE